MLWVALGGALGALGRWGRAGWIARLGGSGFPWGTLVVNVLGSLLLGGAAVALAGAGEETRRFVTIGLLGAFTTFSTYSYETVLLAQEGAWLRALTYAALSVVLALAAIVAGGALGLALRR